ncbi:MAG TPA: hypothetical protein VEV83_15925 [Parafilimonas sp.]|nr:hypothetical protein [Parafilimonas sp.]
MKNAVTLTAYGHELTVKLLDQLPSPGYYSNEPRYTSKYTTDATGKLRATHLEYLWRRALTCKLS